MQEKNARRKRQEQKQHQSKKLKNKNNNEQAHLIREPYTVMDDITLDGVINSRPVKVILDTEPEKII